MPRRPLGLHDAALPQLLIGLGDRGRADVQGAGEDAHRRQRGAETQSPPQDAGLDAGGNRGGAVAADLILCWHTTDSVLAQALPQAAEQPEARCPTSIAPTDRTTATRCRDRMHYDRATAHAILDEAYDCSVALRGRRRAPRAADPARPRRRHALSARLQRRPVRPVGPRRRGAGSASASRCSTAWCTRDRSSTTAPTTDRWSRMGVARPVTDPARSCAAMTALVDKVGAGPGRRQPAADPAGAGADRRPRAAARPRSRSGARTGGVRRRAGRPGLPHWAGVLPVRRVAGPPETDAGVTAAPPAYLPGGPRSPWHTAGAAARASTSRLEPLAPGARGRAVRGARRRGGLAVSADPAAADPRGDGRSRRRPAAPRSGAASACRGPRSSPRPAWSSA